MDFENETARLESTKNIDINSGGYFVNNAGNILSGEKLSVTAKLINNYSTDLGQNGYLQGESLSLNATTGEINNTGVIFSSGQGTIVAQNSIINNGNIELGSGKSEVTSNTGAIKNSGLIKSTKSLTMKAPDIIENIGKIESPDLTINSKIKLVNESKGKITAIEKLILNHNPIIENKGSIEFDVLEANKEINKLENTGTLKGGELKVKANNDFSNTGTIFGQDLIEIMAPNINNLKTGYLISSNKIDLKAEGGGADSALPLLWRTHALCG